MDTGGDFASTTAMTEAEASAVSISIVGDTVLWFPTNAEPLVVSSTANGGYRMRASGSRRVRVPPAVAAGACTSAPLATLGAPAAARGAGARILSTTTTCVRTATSDLLIVWYSTVNQLRLRRFHDWNHD